ncbi:MAG: hypothetical protein U5K51_16940 [Flavobacteriaceae bacterium]|nr:hypothetical protein [Flavobacteriaceae bacterium]
MNRIYSNLAVMDVHDKKLFVKELAPGVSLDYLTAKYRSNALYA